MLYSEYLDTTYNGKPLPDYYNSMYLDGYSPNEILWAQRKTMLKNLQAQEEDYENFKLVSEILIK